MSWPLINPGKTPLYLLTLTKGYICDADGNMGSNVANVMCKMLGFQYGRSLPNFGFVQTNIRIQELVYVFDSIKCQGDENSLFDCQLGNWRLE